VTSATVATASVDIAHLREWVGREQMRQEVIAPFPASALAGLLDRATAPASGDALPLLWQWLYFLDTPRRATTASDGHPARGGFLPPVPLPRRMWAGGHLRVHRPLVIGAVAERRSMVQSVELKEGKSGPLVFVNVAHEYMQSGKSCISEVQNIVYREPPTGPAPLPAGETARQGTWSETLTPDAHMLFRFSALTYNGHRIHYDRAYAQQEEFYPGLVVHGPLLATLLLESLIRRQPAAQMREFSFRAQRPVFDGRALCLNGEIDAGQARLWTADADNCVGMQASAVLE
jgi:3-methylfumaryl-CoA hydratase